MFFETAKLAGEIYRKEMPGRKLLIPWGDPGFAIPLLRAGFPTNLIDGCGLDVPNFERLPEAQLADNVVHRLYQLRKEFEKVGIKKPQLQYCEGTFVPTEPGAVTWREQMDIYTRWSLISMAYGVDRFYAGWFAFDATNYYGSEHYGGCGIQRRVPYCDPKPAYAAFATMTQMLNEANFDGWIPTGSLTTYCLRFKKPDNSLVYALWTLRGKRPVQIITSDTNDVSVTDSMNNTRPADKLNFADFKGGTVITSPSVVYVTIRGHGDAIKQIRVGEPDHTDSLPDKSAKQIADLGDGTWRFTEERDTIYENNHWGFYPAPAAPGSFSATVASDATQDNVLFSKLGKQERVRELMPWYKVLRPRKPIAIAGAPSHLGLWVKGNSDWGRVIYVLRDAHGERWISIGTQDDYNCNDIHAWSSFNFDGWRYLRFEMPGHLGWDSYRKNGTTWWRSGLTPKFQTSGAESERAAAKARETGDQIVDLPIALEAIIVERRTHLLYVNDVQPVASDEVAFGKMLVEYESPADRTDEAVRLSRLRMPAPTGVPDLPNPIADLARDGVGAPTKITKLEPPEHIYDGTRAHVWFEPVEGATKYCVWVSAHADGRGATNMAPAGITNGQLITGLRAGVKLYYWVTYEDKDKKVSKPSPVREEVLIDNFKEK